MGNTTKRSEFARVKVGPLEHQIANFQDNRPSEALPKWHAIRDEDLSDTDVLQAAEAAISHYGSQAPTYCARKIVDMLERGELKIVAKWLAIWQATLSLLED